MNSFTKLLSGDKIIYRSGIAASVLLFLTLLAAGISYFFLPPVIPLFNQMPWGEGRLGIRETIFFPVVLAFIIFFLNTSIAVSVYGKMPLVSRISTVTIIFISLFAFLLTVRTILLIL